MEELGNLEEEKKGNDIVKLFPIRKKLEHDFGTYEFRVLLITQLGYIPIAASMLISTFIEPSEQYCATHNSTDFHSFDKTTDEFYSLAMEFGIACKQSTHTTAYVSSALMWGALVGSFLCGILSDAIGRLPVFSGCLAGVSVMNMMLCFSNHFNWHFVTAILFMLGFTSGGYMVTNFVILTESFELAKSRLLVVSLNGWSLAMIITAGLAYLTKQWYAYHLVISVTAIVLAFIANRVCFESCRWLSAKGNHLQAKSSAIQIQTINGVAFENEDIEEMEWYEILGFTKPVHIINSNWTTLFRTPRFLKPTIVLFYCFLASSIVSFGFYFSLDVLPGNRYFNLASMGVFKFLLGFTPFLLSKYLTKRIIAISSVSICSIAAASILPIQIFDITWMNWSIRLLSLFVAAGIDPTWKINHLYSAELFPTSVRSIGRGFANSGGRLGSVLAPMIVFLRAYSPIIPHTIFFVLLIIQLTVVIAFLPNDNDKNANEMDEE